jgi:hypothetical protein
VPAIFFSLLARIRFEGQTIFNNKGQRSEARDAGDLDSVTQSGTGEIAQFA